MPNDWRLANSLVTFREQCDEAWPNRKRTADGTIGDERHQQESSGHNPDSFGVVVAFDLTHDPFTGPDCAKVFEELVTSKDQRLSQGYVIWDHHIWQPGLGIKVYRGSDPHTGHLHLSVGHDTYPYKGDHGTAHLYDNGSPWQLEVFDRMADILVPLPDNYPYNDHKPGELVPIAKYLQIIGHQIFADRQIDQEDLAVDKKA